jgi:hypothetical protein
MDALTIPVEVCADRRLVIDLPASVPTGPADVVIVPRPDAASLVATPERERVRAKLLEAGLLATDLLSPLETTQFDDDEDDLAALGQLVPGGRSLADLLDEDRGQY